jgi:hypothetical protein
LDNYDDEQFQNIGFVPIALKQRVYDKGDIATRSILQEMLTQKINTVSSSQRTQTSLKTTSSRKGTN